MMMMETHGPIAFSFFPVLVHHYHFKLTGANSGNSVSSLAATYSLAAFDHHQRVGERGANLVRFVVNEEE